VKKQNQDICHGNEKPAQIQNTFTEKKDKKVKSPLPKAFDKTHQNGGGLLDIGN
jgi:hypothetical protein